MIFTRSAAGLVVVSSAANAQIMAAKTDGTLTASSVVALLGIIGTLVGVIVGVLAIIRAIRTTRRENEADGNQRTQLIMDKIDSNQRTTDDRLKALEVRAERFVPGDIIDAKIEHLKANRQAVELRQEEKVKEIDLNVHALCTQVAKLEERGDAMSQTQLEIKDLVKELRSDMKLGFEKIASDQRRAA